VTRQIHLAVLSPFRQSAANSLSRNGVRGMQSEIHPAPRVQMQLFPDRTSSRAISPGQRLVTVLRRDLLVAAGEQEENERAVLVWDFSSRCSKSVKFLHGSCSENSRFLTTRFFVVSGQKTLQVPPGRLLLPGGARRRSLSWGFEVPDGPAGTAMHFRLRLRAFQDKSAKRATPAGTTRLQGVHAPSLTN
jgi:hypothetical protein